MQSYVQTTGTMHQSNTDNCTSNKCKHFAQTMVTNSTKCKIIAKCLVRVLRRPNFSVEQRYRNYDMANTWSGYRRCACSRHETSSIPASNKLRATYVDGDLTQWWASHWRSQAKSCALQPASKKYTGTELKTNAWLETTAEHGKWSCIESIMHVVSSLHDPICPT